MRLGDGDILVVVPALNEEASVARVVHEILAAAPGAHLLVVDDGSTDGTAAAAREAGADVVTNVFNLGVGGAMRVGFRYAASRGYLAVVQVDADGQHDPRDLCRLLAPLDDRPTPQTVIGARFAQGADDFDVPLARRWAMRLLAAYLSRRTRVTLTDVTSGFRAHNRAAVELFARTYPAEYLADTVESLVVAAEAGGTVLQVPVTMRPRLSGRSTQSTLRATLYLVRVALMLALSLFRRQPDHGRRRGTARLAAAVPAAAGRVASQTSATLDPARPGRSGHEQGGAA